MVSSGAHEQSTQRGPETLHIDLPTTSAVQEQLSNLALLLGDPTRLQKIIKLRDGVFDFKLTPELQRLRDDVLNIVSYKICCSSTSND
jgi:hypothetical protein